MKVENVTEKWLSSVLKIQEKDVLHLKKERESNGFLSTIVHARILQSEKEVDLFIKVNPLDEDFNKLLNITFIDVTEVEFYRSFIGLLSDHREKLNLLFPKFFGGDYDLNENSRGFYLILEDLRPFGYEIKDFNHGLSARQVEKSLQALAQFHAYGFNFSSNYSHFSSFFHNYSNEGIMKSQFDKIILDLKEDSEYSDLFPVMEKLFRPYRERDTELFKKLWDLDPTDRDFIIHGDLWGNNVLFNENDECKIIDWQFLTKCSSPYLDIGTLAFISMSPEDTEALIDRFLTIYYSSFLELIHPSKMESLPWKSLNEFKHTTFKACLIKVFLWSIISYDVAITNPNLKKRYFWIYRKCIQIHPLIFT